MDTTSPIATDLTQVKIVKQPTSIVDTQLNEASWNTSVFKKWDDEYIKQRDTYISPEQKASIDTSINDGLYNKAMSIDKASVGDKAGAMIDMFVQQHDFTMLGNKLEEKTYTPNKDWIETVSQYEHASTLAKSSGAPANSEIRISKTKSYEEFVDVVDKLKNDASVSEHINNTIGSGLQTTAAIASALTGLETIAAVALPWTAEALAIKVARTATTLESAIAAERIIQTQKTIAMASNLALSTAVPLIQSNIREDYTFEDGLTSWILTAGFNQFQLSKIYKTTGHDISELTKTYKMNEVLGRLDTTPLLPAPSAVKMLEYKPTGLTTEENVIYQEMRGTGKAPIIASQKASDVSLGAKESVFKGIVTKMDMTIAKLTKELDNLAKRETNPALGRELRETTIARKAVVEGELKELTTSRVAFNKAINLSKQYKVVNKLSKAFPALFKEDVKSGLVSTATKHVDDAVANLEKNVHPDDLKDFVEETVKANGGLKLTAKATKEGVVLGVTTKSGKFKELIKNNKLKSTLGASVIASSGLMASDGEGNFVSDLPSYALAAFALYLFGVPAAKSLINNGVIKSITNPMKGIVSAVASDALAKTPAGVYVGKLYALHNASLIAMGFTYKTAFYKGTESFKKVANDLFWDIDNPTAGTSAVFIKRREVERNATQFYRVYNERYASYTKAMQKDTDTFIGKILSKAEMKSSFNKLISDAIENPNAIFHPDVIAVAKVTSAILKDINARAVAAGVKGFTAENIIENYLTQVTKNDSILKIVIGSDGKWERGGVAYEAIRKQYKNMYEGAHSGKKGYKAGDLDRISYEIMDDIEAANNSNIRGNVADMLGDTVGMAKHRRELDKTMFRDFTLNVNGSTFNVTLGHLFERDVETLIAGYSNAMEGHIALARKGYKSYTEVLDLAGKELPEVKRVATIGINQIIGRSNYDSHSTLANTMRGLSNLTPAIVMPLSAFMQIKEGGSTVIRTAKNWEHFKLATSELKNVLMSRGSDDAYVNWMMDLDARGQTMMANKMHTRLYDDSAVVSEGVAEGASSMFAAKAAKARDFAMIAYGIAPITDIGQRMNSILNMDLLTKVAHGTKRLSITEMESYGLTPSILAKVKSNLTLNSKGQLTDSSMKALEKNPELYEEISGVVFNMGQTQMLTPMIGASPAMFHESTLGAAMGTLSSFAFNAYSTYGTPMVKGMSRGEPSTYLDLTLWFGSMYAVQEMKDALKGRERTEQEKIIAALMQMPFTAPASLIGSFTDPVVFSTTDMAKKAIASDMASLLDVMGGGTDD